MLLSRWFLVLHSAKWERQQCAAFAKGNERKTIGTELLKGEGFQKFQDEIQSLFWQPDRWKAVPGALKTVRLRGLSTACIARAQAGVAQLIIEDSKQLPHALQRILFDPDAAAELRTRRKCRWRSYTEKWFRRYPTVNQMQTNEAKSELLLIAWLHTRCQSLFESRFALIRSLVNQRQHTWEKSFLAPD